MKDKVTIVLFPDASITLFANPVGKKEVTEGARFFECEDKLPVIEICEWYAKNFSHPKIKERAKI